MPRKYRNQADNKSTKRLSPTEREKFAIRLLEEGEEGAKDAIAAIKAEEKYSRSTMRLFKEASQYTEIPPLPTIADFITPISNKGRPSSDSV